MVTGGDDGVGYAVDARRQARLVGGARLADRGRRSERDGVVATGRADGSIRLCGAGDGDGRAQTLLGHTGAITSLAFSPDGGLLASGSADHTARIWMSERRASCGTRSPGTRSASRRSRSARTACLVLTASVDGDARLWSAATGRTVQRLSFHVSTVSQASFSSDGRWIVTAGPTTAGIWQVRTGRLLYFLGGVSGQLTSAAFGLDSRRIVVGTPTEASGTFDCARCARTSRAARRPRPAPALRSRGLNTARS